MKVTAVIPAYTEEETVSRVVSESKRYVDEVIVVDDGSVDETFVEAQEAGALVLAHQKNKGKGEALRTGFKRALELGADVIVTLDADAQHDPNEIPKLLLPIIEANADVVVGSREKQGMPWIRRLSNALATMCLRFLGLKLLDTQCGFRAWTSKALETVQTQAPRYVAESAMLLQAHNKGFRIVGVPITTINAAKSSISPIRDTVQFLDFTLKELFASLRISKAFGKLASLLYPIIPNAVSLYYAIAFVNAKQDRGLQNED